MGQRQADGSWKDACLDKLKSGEPFFIIRAQDKTAPRTVRNWVHDVENRYAIQAADGRIPPMSKEVRAKLDDALATAEAMEVWGREYGSKLPD